MKKQILLSIFSLSALYGIAQQNYWTPVNESAVSKGKNLFANDYRPAEYKLYRLQEAQLFSGVKGAPMERTVKTQSSTFIISIPNAEGKMEQFRFVEAPVMTPALAAKYPEIKTYTGKGIDDPSASIRFDVTPLGFHAMVSSANRPTYYINPIDKDNGIYVVNPRSEGDKSTFTCDTDDAAAMISETNKKSPLKGNADDGKLRTFRLALCVNGEYSQFFLNGKEANDTVRIAKVMASLNTNLSRANEVYERDFGLRLVYVDKQDSLVFLNPKTDPWPANPPLFGTAWNTKTQTTIDKIIGKDNYDIGHLLGKVSGDNNNGNAACIGCVCVNKQKGSGFTAYNNPSAVEFMVIDYWTHEMGHQLGANHIFSFRTESAEANVEPGSGSTIMGYAGITGSTDVQPHSDDYFNAISIGQVTTYIKSQKGGCAVVTETGNHTPVVKTEEMFIIPKSTPFILSGSATDADKGDVLTYTWEQIDNFESKGSNTMPNVESTTGPAFRSMKYSTTSSRSFPNLPTVIDGKRANKWEALPNSGRNLNFRLTVRDNHSNGGSNNSADVLVVVDGDSGPFEITSQDTASKAVPSWEGGEMEIITWDVANTDKDPVNVKKVNILLSLDGGNTFNIVLASGINNNGKAEILVPKVNTQKARVKIEAVGNIFYDISNIDFVIKSVLPVTWTSFSAKQQNESSLLEWSVAAETNNNHFNVQRSTNGTLFTEIGKVNSLGNTSLPRSYQYTDNSPVNGINYYRLQQVDNDGRTSYSEIAKVVFKGNSAKWKIQPNPAVTSTDIQAPSDLNNVSIQLINTDGKVVFQLQKTKVNAGERITIPVNQLSKGMYIIKLISTESSTTEKLMVQ